MRRPKTDRVPRTRAGGQWTEAGFWGFLRSGLRRMSIRWPPRELAEIAARREYHGDNKRRKWEYQCAMCDEWCAGKDIQVDHIEACGQLKDFSDLSGFCERLFCEPEGFQVLCSSCHKPKTKKSRRK